MNNLLKHKPIYFTLLISLFLFTNCINKEQNANTDSITQIDTIIIEPKINPDTIDSINPNKKFKNSDEAIEFMQSSRHWDKYNQGIIVRMAKENLLYATKLLNNIYDRFIVVDKGTMRVMLYDRFGRKEREYKMACGKNYGTKKMKADSRTPEGFFSAEGIYDSTDWLFTDDNGVTSPKKGQFGPRFIRLKTPTTSQIGIHGTCSPWSLGHRCSHGCIRISNDNILELVELVEPGIPIIVNPSRKDIIVNMQEGTDIKWITVDDKPIRAPKPGEIKRIIPDTTSIDTVIIDSISTIQIDSIVSTKTEPIEVKSDSININKIESGCDSIQQ